MHREKGLIMPSIILLSTKNRLRSSCYPASIILRSDCYHLRSSCSLSPYNPGLDRRALARAFHPVLRPAALALRSVEALPTGHSYDR
jgi:hypothetical protein